VEDEDEEEEENEEMESCDPPGRWLGKGVVVLDQTSTISPKRALE
jgi:hypothetical protein